MHFANRRGMTMLRTLLTLAAFFLAAFPQTASAITVRELTRVRGQGQVRLQGVGLVMGLRGTGDDIKDGIVARPMAALLKDGGNEPASISDFGKGKSAAVVLVTCTIPESGAMADDVLDVQVSVMLSATSLVGGRLVSTALSGVLPGQPVVALAEGNLEAEDPGATTVMRITKGALVTRDVMGPELLDKFELLIAAPYVGWAASNQLAIAVNAKADPINNAVAKAINERTVQVTIPPAERSNRAAFLADVFNADVNLSLIELPAQIIANQRTGAIIVTGDVTIKSVALTHKNLTITKVTPPPVGTALTPVVARETWTGVGTNETPNDTAKINDLLDAFKQFNIPVRDQINLLEMMYKAGHLNCKLILE
jgi:flagellar P-ring protein precursor FlgI